MNTEHGCLYEFFIPKNKIMKIFYYGKPTEILTHGYYDNPIHIRTFNNNGQYLNYNDVYNNTILLIWIGNKNNID